MKKKSCLTLALILVMVQLLSVFAILPVGADGTTKNYEVQKSTVAPTVDGTVDAIWGYFEPTEKFTYQWTVGTYAKANVTATAKLMYVENGDKIDVYVLIEASGLTGGWSNRTRSTVALNGNNTKHLGANADLATDANLYHYRGSSKWNGSAKFNAEHYFQLTKEQAQSFTFDMYVVDGPSGDNYCCYSWADTHASNHGTSSKGTLTFSDTVYYPKNASVYRSVFAPEVDGVKDVIWDSFESTDNFTYRYTVGTYAKANVTAAAKLMYVENGDKIDVYVLIEASGLTGGWSTRTRSTVALNGNNMKHLNANANLATDANLYNYRGTSTWKNGSSGGFIAEHYFQLTKEQAQSFTFDMYVVDGPSGDNYCSYSWGDTHTSNGHASKRVPLNFVDETKDVISVETAVGASVRVDTANPKQSGIRFATTVDADRLAAWEAAGATVTTGTLILPTASLAAANIADADFTEAALIAVGMEEGKHYYNIVNQGNEWVKDAQGNELTGTWYGTLFDVKVFDRQFSAIGYVIVEMDGVATVAYGGYVSTNARSIAYVAGEAMKGEIEGDAGNWTTEQEAILKGFYAAN